MMEPTRLLLAALAIASLLLAQAMALASQALGDYSSGFTRVCTVPIAAVSSNGEGVIGELTVRVSYPGSGKVYISTSPASEVDTQGSARIAAFAASLLAGVDMLDYDFYYDIESPSVIVGGPSAGSAMALATYQLLVGSKCAAGVVATGMIQPDTSIGPVGGLKEKLEATARSGGSVFIIPAGQEEYTYKVRKVERTGPIIRIVEEPVTVNLVEYGEGLGVRVVSASTLEEAFKLGVAGSETLRETAVSLRGLPSWLEEPLRSYISRLYSMTESYLEYLDGVDSSYLRDLAEASRQHYSSSMSLLEEGMLYSAAVEAVLAAMAAETAYTVVHAINNDLDVTPFVVEANETLTKAWLVASQALNSIEYTMQVDALVKAYSKAGLASYYYSLGLERLARDDNGYKLPYSLLSGIDTSGIESIVTAKRLADWSLFWANLSLLANAAGAKIDWERVDTVSRLLLAQAKTTIAYVESLLRETGIGGGVRESAYLLDLALSSNNSVAIIGLAIESIAESTRVIHESFTLDLQRTAEGLESLAYRITAETSSLGLQSRLLLELASTNNGVEHLLALSRAVLYGWAIGEIASVWRGMSSSGGEEAPNVIAEVTVTETVTATKTITVTKTVREEGPSPLPMGSSSIGLAWLAVGIAAGLAIGLSLYVLTRKL